MEQNMDMKVIDKGGEWFINIAAFRMVDPTPREDGSTHIFEPGVKYKIVQTEWMKAQPTIKVTDDEDEKVLEEVQVPAQPGEKVLNIPTVDNPDSPAAAALKAKK
jgi:hypothetical protein